MNKYLLILLSFCLPTLAQEPNLISEKDYVNHYCKGIIEHRLWDGTRVDCLTDLEAQEYDFGKKYHEAIGQSLWYAANTGTVAAIVLIVADNSDAKGVMRAARIIKHYNLPITLHILKSKDLTS